MCQKKSVTVFSDSHRRITWSGMPGSQRLLRFVSCGRTPQGSPRRRLQPTRPLAAWELETPIQGPFLLKPVFQLQPFCKPMMFFKKLAVGKERQLIHMVSCILAWKLPWAEESSRLQSHEATRVRHKWVSEQTCHLLIGIKQRASATHSAATSYGPPPWKHTSQTPSRPEGQLQQRHERLLLPISQHGKSFLQGYPRFQRESPSLQLN